MKLHHLFFLIIPFLLNSCLVIHSGSVSSGPLLDRTDQYVDIGIGHASSVFVFGIGNVSNDDLVLKAKNNLYLNRPLAKNEYYSNFTTAFTNKIIFLVVHCTKVTVSADLLRPCDTTQGAFSKDFKRLSAPKIIFRVPKLLNRV